MSKIKAGKTGVEVIKEWVIKTFLKQQPKGVLTTLPKKDFVDVASSKKYKDLSKFQIFRENKLTEFF